MKKKLSIILPILIMIIVMAVCIFSYLVFTNNLLGLFASKEESTNTIPTSNDLIILSKSELPKIGTSITLQPLCNAIIKEYTQDSEISETIFDISTEEEEYKKLINGEIDILFATEPSEDIKALATANEIEFEMIPVAKEAFVFYVNSENSVDSLELSDIQNIYTGQITNWAQLGGKNIEILAFQRTTNSRTQREMINSVMGNLDIQESFQEIFYDKTYGEIDDVDATYDNSLGAIGYSYYYEAQTMYDTDEQTEDTIKFLKINDVEPTYETVQGGSYPLQTYYYLVKIKDKNSEIMQIFTDNITLDRVKNAIKEAGYIDN